MIKRSHRLITIPEAKCGRYHANVTISIVHNALYFPEQNVHRGVLGFP